MLVVLATPLPAGTPTTSPLRLCTVAGGRGRRAKEGLADGDSNDVGEGMGKRERVRFHLGKVYV